MTIPSCDIQAGADGAPRPRPQATGARRMALHFLIVSVGASALGMLLGGARVALSVALGVTLAGANLLLMRKITSALAEASGGSAAWALALPFKLAALVGVAYALVDLRVAQPVPLAIGFALLPLTGVFLPRASSVPDLYTPSSPARPGASRPRRESMK